MSVTSIDIRESMSIMIHNPKLSAYVSLLRKRAKEYDLLDSGDNNQYLMMYDFINECLMKDTKTS